MTRTPDLDPRPGRLSMSIARATGALRLAGAAALAVVALLLVAVPVLADGGVHVTSTNSGTLGLNADSCAGCHRAHTAKAEYLLAATSEELLCLSCHSNGLGATTDVEVGVQFKTALSQTAPAQDETDASVVAGALRGGGFLYARIDSANPTRISYPRWNYGSPGKLIADFSAKVPVLAAGQATTSGHLALAGASFSARGTAWGNASADPMSSAYVGAQVDLTCASCHNPHGNGNYRILNPIPSPHGVGFTPSPVEVNVTDAALPAPGQVRNYTVKAGVLLSDIASTPPTDGDYWRRYEPWNCVPSYDVLDPYDDHGIVPATCGHQGDRPNGLTAFTLEISSWCITCHTRYDGAGANLDSGDPVYKYRHATGGDVPCTICHVSHGSNASMTGTDAANSSAALYPDGLASSSSRLLKIDNRGTCQMCHDPTGTESYANVIRPS